MIVRRVWLALSTVFIVGAGVAASSGHAIAQRPRTPVLVELFTSEGCSSCPPADDILARLIVEQPIDDVEIVALGFHVDYWNRLGWRDAFSSMEYTARQQDYAGSRQTAKVYTPQAIVDGVHQAVGSDWRSIRQGILDTVAVAKLPLSIGAPEISNGRLMIKVDAPPAPDRQQAAEVHVAVTEDGLVTDVKRGENANRRLTHAAVVRSFARIGRWDPKSGFSTTHDVRIDSAWRHEALRIVAFLQERGTKRIVGLAARGVS